jgi:uncharacterized OsmC-like protein
MNQTNQNIIKESGMPQVDVTVRAKSETPSRLKVQSGKFKMIIDEPEAMGGTNMGPSPIQVLLMALAGCLSVTGHAIAQQKGLKLNDLKIEIKGSMNPCNFMGCSFDERAGFQQINVIVKPDFENASDAQIKDWLEETERRCPVTDNIKEGTHINVSIK